MSQLPTDLENLCGYYAFGGEKYNLSQELGYLISSRGCIPNAFLANTVYVGKNPPPGLSYFYVNNPLITFNPFFPWSLVHKESKIFSNVFIYWAHQIKAETFAKLHTYPKTFMKNVSCYRNSNTNCFALWNNLVSRYLSEPILLNIESYNFGDFEGLFSDITYQLEHAGFIYPFFFPPPLVVRVQLFQPSVYLSESDSEV